MTIKYFNYTHLITLLSAGALVGALYFSLRRRSAVAKEIALYILMGLNLTQHLFKFLVWPHLWGTGFGLADTAYNVCAILIIASPFVFVTKSSLFKQFITYAGTIGPSLALLFPYWYIGKTVLTWDFARFWTCHTLLVATSILPALWGMVKFNCRDGWKFGLVFLAMLSLILVNNTVFSLALGLTAKHTLYEVLLAQNPLMMMAPTAGAEKIKILFELFSPPFLLETDNHPYIPILWYAVPVYLYCTALGYILGCAIDRRWANRGKSPIKQPACGIRTYSL